MTALSSFFSSPLRKWSSVFVLAALVLASTYYYQMQSLGKVQAAYTIANSARFNSADPAYLSRTPSAGDRDTFTISLWTKRANLSSTMFMFSSGTSNDNRDDLYFDSSNRLTWQSLVSNSIVISKASSAVFRDPAKWHHIVVVINTNESTAADRAKIYVDGVQITSFSDNSVTISQGGSVNTNAAVAHRFAYTITGAAPYDGYLSDVYFIDGQALAPTSFGETDANGYWRPKAYSGTYGTNGFKLAFGTGSNLGDDTSGNNNDWTVNAMDATDQVTDTPTNSFATWSPIDKNSNITLSDGNLKATYTGSVDVYGYHSTIAVSSGKWYWESSAQNLGGVEYPLVGIQRTYIAPSNFNPETNLSIKSGTTENRAVAGTACSGASNNDVIMVAFDADNGKLYFGKNGTWCNSGNPDAGTGAVFTGLTDGPFYFAGGTFSSRFAPVNFGQGGTTTITYDSTAGGSFAHSPSSINASGFKALSTANLPEPAVTVPKNYFDVQTYQGTGAAATTTGISFQPSLVWLKATSTASDHGLFDSVRGVFNVLISNRTNAELASSTSLTAFNSDGFSLGTDGTFNTSAKGYISWLWKESPTSGMDIVTYTGTGVAKTEVHALSSAPEMIIVKDRTAASTNDWAVYFATTTTSGQNFLLLNSTAAVAASNTYWNDTAPTASVFSLGTNADVNTNTNSYVAYLFDQVDGFSKFGSYMGNGSADGPFVYTGFKPRFFMWKRTDSADDWHIMDTARNPYNVGTAFLIPNSSGAESTASTRNMDFVSNGIKIRASSHSSTNLSGATYIYAAFAEQPFYYSAQPAAAAFVQAVAFLMGMTF